MSTILAQQPLRHREQWEQVAIEVSGVGDFLEAGTAGDGACRMHRGPRIDG